MQRSPREMAWSFENISWRFLISCNLLIVRKLYQVEDSASPPEACQAIHPAPPAEPHLDGYEQPFRAAFDRRCLAALVFWAPALTGFTNVIPQQHAQLAHRHLLQTEPAKALPTPPDPLMSGMRKHISYLKYAISGGRSGLERDGLHGGAHGMRIRHFPMRSPLPPLRSRKGIHCCGSRTSRQKCGPAAAYGGSAFQFFQPNR
jgi:hypothetical protein